MALAPDRRSGVTGVTTKQVVLAVILLPGVVVVGTLLTVMITGEHLLSALYHTVSTVTTAGLEGYPPTVSGRLLGLGLMVSGVAVFLYAITLLVEFVVGGIMTGLLQQRRMQGQITAMRGHHVICGFGRVGRSVAEELLATGSQVVVLDANPEMLEFAAQKGIPYVHGDGVDERNLLDAGIERAVSLVACSDDDASNTYIVLTARGLRRDIHIVARGSNRTATANLQRAGADQVVSPYATAAGQIAQLISRPHVTAYLTLAQGGDSPFSMEQIEVPAGAPAAGKTVQELRVRTNTGALILAVRKAAGGAAEKAGPDTVVEVGDVVIGVGTVEEIRALEALLLGGP